jgi:hypothetical protein
MFALKRDGKIGRARDLALSPCGVGLRIDR